MLRGPSREQKSGESVKLDKLVKQIRRDATANPKKAALLGLMGLVALYFWAPLAWKWLAPAAGKKSSKVGKVALILTDDPVEANDKAKGRVVSNFRWEKIRQLIEKDSRMSPATFEASWLDPFVSWPTQQENEAEPMSGASVAPPSLPDVEPGDAGLTLTSVVISSRRSTATINGELYREHDVISASVKDHPMNVLEFRIVRIGRQAVQLEREGRTYLLELTKPALAHGDEIGRSGKKQGK